MTISAVIQTGSSMKTAKAADEITAKRVYGDLNEDGKINIFDLMHLKNILLNGDKENKMLKYADVDGDKETSFKDISEMVKYLMTEMGIFEPELELDSDNDGLSDYDEIYKYNTSPNSSINEKDIIVEQLVNSDSSNLAEINTDNDDYKLSFSINASGNANKKLYVSRSPYTNFILNGKHKESVLGKTL